MIFEISCSMKFFASFDGSLKFSSSIGNDVANLASRSACSFPLMFV